MMNAFDLILKVNVFLTAAMFGVIWIVQLVHYPMFAGVDRKSFLTWHKFHSDRITIIVAPLMIGEAMSSSALYWMRQDAVTLGLLLMTLAIWASTFLCSVPIHNRLGKSGAYDDAIFQAVIRRLVATNWIRTLLYSFKVVVLGIQLNVTL